MTPKSDYTLAGVMGWPVAHSRSPLIHTHWIERYSLHGNYVLLPVQPERLDIAVRGLDALGFAGCNLTIPHKVAVLPMLEQIDPWAARIGAVNTLVVKRDGALAGYNTDAHGYLQSLLDAQPHWRADAGPVTVLGAGGAARAIVLALAEHGAPEIRLCNRSLDKAQSLAAEFGAPLRALPWEQRHDALQDCALLVNTTSLGMKGQQTLQLSLERLPQHALVSDIIYVPLQTPLLAAARARGHVTVDGLGMLLNQARLAFEHWFGVLPELSPELRRRIVATL